VQDLTKDVTAVALKRQRSWGGLCRPSGTRPQGRTDARRPDVGFSLGDRLLSR
jgi:hypothetical protein